MERESKFVVDPEKARQALKELDQQLGILSRKQVNPPKIRGLSFPHYPFPHLLIFDGFFFRGSKHFLLVICINYLDPIYINRLLLAICICCFY